MRSTVDMTYVAPSTDDLRLEEEEEEEARHMVKDADDTCAI
jgi:hypothetical protein